MARNALRGIARFVRLLRHAPPENPAMREISAAADRVKGAMHSRSGNSTGAGGGGTAFHSGGRTADKLFGNELAEGHKKAAKNTPPPKAQ